MSSCLLICPQIASEHGIPFMETSAKEDKNIEEVFLKVTEAILDKTTNKETRDATDRVVMDRRVDKGTNNRCC